MSKSNRPTFPISTTANNEVDDIGDDFDNLDDLQFMTSIDTTVKQDVFVDYEAASKRHFEHTFEIDDETQPVSANVPETTTPSLPTPSQTSSFSSSMSNRSSAVLRTLSETRVGRMLKDSSHPGVAIFHVLFKILALFTYIFGGWFVGASNFVTITVICIILLACDFWVVKNISGRLLVGLRWWNKVSHR